MKKEVLITLMTDRKTKTESFFRELLELLYLKYPTLFPEFVSFEEPINVPVENVESALKFLKWMIHCGRGAGLVCTDI